jgi:hypothetical protein
MPDIILLRVSRLTTSVIPLFLSESAEVPEYRDLDQKTGGPEQPVCIRLSSPIPTPYGHQMFHAARR